MDDIKTWLMKRKWFFIVGLFVILFLAASGEKVELTCMRNRGLGDVACNKESKLLGVISLGTKRINGVHGAQLDESYNDEGGTTYRVELLTRDGPVPLTFMYTSGYGEKIDVVNHINAFVEDTSQDTLSVYEPGFLSRENFVCMAIGFPISLGINWLIRWLAGSGSRSRQDSSR